jgi:hypothetical protein
MSKAVGLHWIVKWMQMQIEEEGHKFRIEIFGGLGFLGTWEPGPMGQNRELAKVVSGDA